jgi:hypothetical protein
LRKSALLATVCTIFCFFFVSLASAQQGDIAVGFGTITSPGASPCGFSGSVDQEICPEKGGFYPTIGGDVIFHRRIGVGVDFTWRGGQGLYGGPDGQPYRPILTNVNAVYQPRFGRKLGLDLVGGIGWQTTRYYGYVPTSGCVYLGACYLSSTHFLVDVGAGLRYYVHGHFFVRPEVRYYSIINNTVDFTSDSVVRIGGSIGYTIGPE